MLLRADTLLYENSRPDLCVIITTPPAYISVWFNERFILPFHPLLSNRVSLSSCVAGHASLYNRPMGNISVVLRRKPYIPGPLDTKVYIWFYLAIYIVYKVIYIGKGLYRVKDRWPY